MVSQLVLPSVRPIVRPSLRTRSFAAALAIVALAGCSKKLGPEESQIAARVNDGEISVHQVQAVLQRQPRLVAAAGDAATAKVLDVLVDQELAAQAARSQGLDKLPEVVQTMEILRREALARAWQERIAATVSQPSSDEIDRYYDAHPELFSARRLYLLQEAAVEADAAQLAALEKVVASSQGAESLLVALREAGVRYSARTTATAAEDLPMGVLGPLSKAADGQSILLPQPGGARIYSILQSVKAPVDRRTAQTAIANYLVGERKREAIAEAQRKLRQEGKVTLSGAFAARAASAPAAAPVNQ